VADLLLAHGADVNAKNKDGCTALYQAVYYPPAELLAELLVAHDANVNAKCYGKTPLQEAGMNMVIYKLLRKHGGHR
jgi:ankyrin repeat protein